MNHLYTTCRDSGILWALAFVMITVLTVTTCMKQERLLAEKAPVIVAMRSDTL